MRKEERKRQERYKKVTIKEAKKRQKRHKKDKEKKRQERAHEEEYFSPVTFDEKFQQLLCDLRT